MRTLVVFFISVSALIISISVVAKAASKNYYSLLGVSRTASEEEIAKAYRKLAMKHHPDRWQQAPKAEHDDHESQFKQIQEAYENLKDPGKRFAYDGGSEASLDSSKNNSTELRDVTLILDQISKSVDDDRIVELFSRTNPMGSFIYNNGSVLDMFFDKTLELISLEKFKTLESAKMFLSVTSSWNYALYLMGSRNFPDWSSHYNAIFKVLLCRGTTLKDIAGMLKETRNTYGTLQTPMRLDEGASYGLFETLLEYHLTSTYEEYLAASEILRPIFEHADLVNKLHGSLRGLFQFVHPFVSKMTAKERLDLPSRLGGDPLENLAMVESVLQAQRLDGRMSSSDLTDFLLEHIAYTINERMGGRVFGSESYVSLHKGYSYQKWLDEARSMDDVFSAPYYAERKEVELYKSDLIGLMARYSSVLKELDFNKIASKLKMMTFSLRARVFLQKMNVSSQMSWIAQLPHVEYKKYVSAEKQLSSSGSKNSNCLMLLGKFRHGNGLVLPAD